MEQNIHATSATKLANAHEGDKDEIKNKRNCQWLTAGGQDDPENYDAKNGDGNEAKDKLELE